MRRRFLLAVSAPLAVLSACGLDVVGSDSGAIPDNGGGGSATGQADGGPSGPESLPDGDIGDTELVPFDTGVVDAGCPTVLVDDDFSSGTIDPSRWTVIEDNDNDHPLVARSGATYFVSLIDPGQRDARGAIWLSKQVPTTSFDVQFQVLVDCGSGWFDGCADGFAAAWVDTGALTGAAVPNALDNAGTGNSLGIPLALDGAGVAVDIFGNSSTGDPRGIPALEVLGIDKTKTPGEYKWVLASAGGRYLNRAHTINLSMRKSKLTVKVDGVAQFPDVAVLAPKLSSFGFTAGTGGENGIFYVWDFHSAFYDCDL